MILSLALAHLTNGGRMKWQQLAPAYPSRVIPACPLPFAPPFKGDEEALVGSSCWRNGMQGQVAGGPDLAFVLR